MHRMTCALVVLIVTSPVAVGTSYAPRMDIGVVCLDLETGEPLWQYFPERLGICELATDGQLLYMIEGERDSWLVEYPTGRNGEQFARAVDLETHRTAAGEVLRDDGGLTRESWSKEVDRLPNGDWIEADYYEDKAIRVMTGDTDQVRFTIPVTCNYSGPWLFDDLIVVAHDVQDENGADRYGLFAYDAACGELAWQIDVGRRRGVGRGEKHVYLTGPDGMLAVEGGTGQVAWCSPADVEGWSCTAVQVGERVFTRSHPNHSQDDVIIHCLDATTGRAQWEFKTECWLNVNSLLVHGGKVYTQIVPTPYIRRVRERLNIQGRPAEVSSSLPEYASRLNRYFAELSPAEEALHLRAWHATGDAAGLPLLETAAVGVPDGPTRELAGELAATFPAVRDPQGLLTLLEGAFERQPELSSEIRRIVEQADMLPYDYGRARRRCESYENREHVFGLEEQRLVERYLRLKGRLVDVPPSAHDKQPAYGHSLGEWLEHREKAHGKGGDWCFADVMFSVYPEEALAWAMEHEADLTCAEICSWIENAPFDWVMKRPELMGKWLRSSDPDIQFAAGRRLYRLPEEFAAPLAIGLLTEFAGKAQDDHARAIGCALRRLGQLERADQKVLLEKYAESDAAYAPVAKWQGMVVPCVVSDAARWALGRLGEGGEGCGLWGSER